MNVLPQLLLAIVCLVPAGSAQDVPPASEALRSEWAIREAALGVAGAGLGPREVRSRRWTDRVAALEALRRRAGLGEALGKEVLATVRAALDHDHPNVRARALAVLDLAGAGSISEQRIAVLVHDPFPAVRIELAHLLASDASDAGLAALEFLLDDGDPRVAEAARCGVFFHRSPRADSIRARLLERWGSSEDEDARERYRRALEWCDAGAGSTALLRARFERWSAGGDRALRNRALLAALLLGRNVLEAGEKERGRWVRALEDGWGQIDSPGFAQLFLGAARARGADVGGAFFGILVKSEASRFLTPSGLASAVVASLGPGPALARARSAPPDVMAVLLENLPDRLWSGARTVLAPLLEPPTPLEVRTLLIGILAATLRTGRGPGAADAEALLRGAIGVEASGPKAFRSLVSAAPPEHMAEFATELHAAWSDYPPDERLRALADLPRGLPLPAFRADLLRLVQEPGPGRRSAVELLASARGDPRVSEALRGLVEVDLARFRGVPEGEAHRVEVEVRGELRALAAQDPRGASALLERALLLSSAGTPAAEGIGKTAAALLAKSDAGCAVLAAHLVDGLGARTRIEAAIGLVLAGARGSTDAALVLEAEFDTLASDLAERAVRALGRGEVPAQLAFLERVARDPARPQSVRMASVEALGERGAVGSLVRILAGQGNGSDGGAGLDPRRVAIRTLGRIALGTGEQQDAARRELERLFERLRREDGNENALARERRELLAETLLGVLGRLDPIPEGLAERWLAFPLRDAPRIASERFDGARAPDARFLWRGELECAEAWLETGRLREALARSGAWRRVDPSFLSALGEAVLARGLTPVDRDVARALLEASAVAAAGFPMEGSSSGTSEGWARSRARLLALALASADRERARRLARTLLVERLRGDLPDTVWLRVFGERDLVQGLDPVRRLGALADS